MANPFACSGTGVGFPLGLGKIQMRWVLGWGMALALSPLAASADPMMYNVQMLSFDMWCQETAHYAPDRCDAHTADDEATFEQFRATIERYELPYLKRVEQERDLHTRVLDHDPQQRPNGQ
jgi:hypothetical protein